MRARQYVKTLVILSTLSLFPVSAVADSSALQAELKEATSTEVFRFEWTKLLKTDELAGMPVSSESAFVVLDGLLTNPYIKQAAKQTFFQQALWETKGTSQWYVLNFLRYGKGTSADKLIFILLDTQANIRRLAEAIRATEGVFELGKLAAERLEAMARQEPKMMDPILILGSIAQSLLQLEEPSGLASHVYDRLEALRAELLKAKDLAVFKETYSRVLVGMETREERFARRFIVLRALLATENVTAPEKANFIEQILWNPSISKASSVARFDLLIFLSANQESVAQTKFLSTLLDTPTNLGRMARAIRDVTGSGSAVQVLATACLDQWCRQNRALVDPSIQFVQAAIDIRPRRTPNQATSLAGVVEATQQMQRGGQPAAEVLQGRTAKQPGEEGTNQKTTTGKRIAKGAKRAKL
jgi:hypothetical protein